MPLTSIDEAVQVRNVLNQLNAMENALNSRSQDLDRQYKTAAAVLDSIDVSSLFNTETQAEISKRIAAVDGAIAKLYEDGVQLHVRADINPDLP